MFNNTVYNQSIRKCIVAFGTLLNNIELYRYDENGNIIKKFKVPLKYSSKDKLIQRVRARPELVEDTDTQYSLPRMAFTMTDVQYDNSRKLAVTQKITSKSVEDNSGSGVYFSPVPIRLTLDLNLITKTNDEALEIIEKIIPIFQPSFFVTINVSEQFEERRDLSYTLRNVNFVDEFEGSFENTRFIMYNLSFEAKTYLMSTPSTDASIIKNVIVDLYAGLTASETTERRRLTQSVKATQDYNNDGNIDELDDALVNEGDDYDVITIWSDFNE